MSYGPGRDTFYLAQSKIYGRSDDLSGNIGLEASILVKRIRFELN